MSKRSRSRSPSRERKRHRDDKLPYDAEPISESDYFQKMSEFQQWLRDEKDRYFDELSGDKARHYFKKFVKRWNHGELSKELYKGVSSRSHTAYKWSFAKDSKASSSSNRGDIREDSNRSGPSRRIAGPSMPSSADKQLASEYAEELAEQERKAARKKERAETRHRIEEMVGPKESGREGMLEKKKVQRENERSFRDAKDDGGLEVSEDVLMGGGDSFQAMIARRDAARRKNEEKRKGDVEAKTDALRDRTSAMREKEKATMEMFKAMAKERFG